MVAVSRRGKRGGGTKEEKAMGRGMDSGDAVM